MPRARAPIGAHMRFHGMGPSFKRRTACKLLSTKASARAALQRRASCDRASLQSRMPPRHRRDQQALCNQRHRMGLPQRTRRSLLRPRPPASPRAGAHGWRSQPGAAIAAPFLFRLAEFSSGSYDITMHTKRLPIAGHEHLALAPQINAAFHAALLKRLRAAGFQIEPTRLVPPQDALEPTIIGIITTAFQEATRQGNL